MLEEEGISKGQSEYINEGSIGVIETSLSLTEAEDVAKNVESGVLVADLEFAQEQFVDFLYNYTPNTQLDLGNISGAPENNELLETFDDAEVEALWGGSGHEGTVDGVSYTCLDSTKQTFLKRVAIVPDNDAFTLDNSVKTSSPTYGDNKYQALKNAIDDASNNYQQIFLNENDSTFSSAEQRETLEKCMYIVCNSKVEGQANAGSDFQERFALKILGLAIHLAGDTYAHKTVVPTNVTFSNDNVEGSARENSTIYRGNSNDFTGFLSARYNIGSCGLVTNMLNSYFRDRQGFSVDWFLHSNYSLRLANLKVYVYNIGMLPTNQSKLSKLNNLDSRVAVSDLLIHNSTTPNVTTNNSWNTTGYITSFQQ